MKPKQRKIVDRYNAAIRTLNAFNPIYVEIPHTDPEAMHLTAEDAKNFEDHYESCIKPHMERIGK